MSDDALREELADLAAMARELLHWEETIAGTGVPEVEIPSAPERPGAAESSSSVQVGEPAQRPAAAAPPERIAEPAEQVEPAAPDGPDGRRHRLALLAEEAAGCTRCDLAQGRTRSVFARGNPDAEIVFVGEGPGYHEDQQGLPFVGKAGQLLDRMVAAMGYGRDEVYICNVVKCRPPENRTPLPNESAACLPYLEQQLDLVQPKVIVALGRTAAQGLGLVDETTRGWRGAWRTWRGVPVMSTYHPAFLLRNPNMKRPVWEDLQQVMARLGRTPPPSKKQGS